MHSEWFIDLEHTKLRLLTTADLIYWDKLAGDQHQINVSVKTVYFVCAMDTKSRQHLHVFYRSVDWITTTNEIL